MTSKGLGKLCLETHTLETSAHIDWGPRGGSSVRRPGSKDPHRCERKYLELGEFWFQISTKCYMLHGLIGHHLLYFKSADNILGK
jgi:hypothetical protein